MYNIAIVVSSLLFIEFLLIKSHCIYADLFDKIIKIEEKRFKSMETFFKRVGIGAIVIITSPFWAAYFCLYVAIGSLMIILFPLRFLTSIFNGKKLKIKNHYDAEAEERIRQAKENNIPLNAYVNSPAISPNYSQTYTGGYNNYPPQNNYPTNNYPPNTNPNYNLNYNPTNNYPQNNYPNYTNPDNKGKGGR